MLYILSSHFPFNPNTSSIIRLFIFIFFRKNSVSYGKVSSRAMFYLMTTGYFHSLLNKSSKFISAYISSGYMMTNSFFPIILFYLGISNLIQFVISFCFPYILLLKAASWQNRCHIRRNV